MSTIQHSYNCWIFKKKMWIDLLN